MRCLAPLIFAVIRVLYNLYAPIYLFACRDIILLLRKIHLKRSAVVNTSLVHLIQFVCYVRSRRGLISSVSRRDRIAIGKLHSDVCRMHPQKRERAVSQSALMSVSSGKVVLLKEDLIYCRSFSLPPSLVPFSLLREQDDLIFYERRRSE